MLKSPVVRTLPCFALVLAWSVTIQLAAAEPLVRNLNLRGLQIEGATTLIIDGDHLAGARLLLPFAAKCELKTDSTEKKGTFEVTLPGDVIPGYYNLRVVTDGGVSLPILISVDRLPHNVAAPTVEQLPASLHGNIGGSAVFETKFAGKAGQALLVEVEAQRLDSKLRPVLHLYNAKRKQLAWSWPTSALQGDARLEATLPEDGDYFLALHDLEYGPPGTGFFRLKIGSFAFVDQVFPAVISRGQPAKVEIGAALPIMTDVAPQASLGPFPLVLPTRQNWSGPRPFVEISSHQELLEQSPPPEGGQLLPAETVGVSGRLATPLEEDRYRVTVAPNAKLRLEVFSERYGSPIDTAIIVRNEKGDQLARGEDSPGTVDPVLDYNVPAASNTIIVGVQDALGRGGPRGVYRLVVTPQGAAKSHFRLTTPAQRVSLASGGRAVLPVFAEREDHETSLEISGVNLPIGVKLEGATIPAGRDGGLISLVREGAGEAAIAKLRGKTADGSEQPVIGFNIQPGQPRSAVPNRIQPWLDEELAIALTTANAADFQIDWRDLPNDAGLFPGRKLALPIKLVRPADPLVVRLTLLTGQAPQFVNGQVDQNRMLRAEQAVELAANVAEGQVSVAIPLDLPQTAYQMTVQAELLTADKQAVVARAFTPIRDLLVKHQLHLQLSGPPKIEVPLDAKTGAIAKIEGKLERREGLTGDVQLTLTGLPAGVAGNPLTVKADAVDFSFVVNIPATFLPSEMKNLKFSASAADPQNNNVRVVSRPLLVSIVVQPPPPPSQP